MEEIIICNQPMYNDEQSLFPHSLWKYPQKESENENERQQYPFYQRRLASSLRTQEIINDFTSQHLSSFYRCDDVESEEENERASRKRMKRSVFENDSMTMKIVELYEKEHDNIIIGKPIAYQRETLKQVLLEVRRHVIHEKCDVLFDDSVCSWESLHPNLFINTDIMLLCCISEDSSIGLCYSQALYKNIQMPFQNQTDFLFVYHNHQINVLQHHHDENELKNPTLLLTDTELHVDGFTFFFDNQSVRLDQELFTLYHSSHQLTLPLHHYHVDHVILCQWY